MVIVNNSQNNAFVEWSFSVTLQKNIEYFTFVLRNKTELQNSLNKIKWIGIYETQQCIITLL